MTAELLERTVYPEEVTHCAVGVRWLTWLHAQAHASDGAGGQCAEPPQGSGGSPCSVAGAAQQAAPRGAKDGDATATAARESGSSGEGDPEDADQPPAEKAGNPEVVGNGSGNQQVAEEELPCSGRQQAAAEESPCSLGGAADANGLDWMADGRRHVTVEEWFHELVRKHFWGALKPPFNEVARHEAGLMPSWYLPLAKPF